MDDEFWFECCTDLEEQLAGWDIRAKAATIQHKALVAKQWHHWAERAMADGGRIAHKLAKKTGGWKPTTVQGKDGNQTALPEDILNDQVAKWAKMPSGVPPRDVAPEWLPVTADELREVSRSFSRRTCSTVDGFHVRQFSLLSTPLLDTLGVLFQITAGTGIQPQQVCMVTCPMLVKPKGGTGSSASFLATTASS